MGLFKFGGSKSSSSSSSFSRSFDNLDRFAFGTDRSTSRSRSGGRSFDRSGSQTSQRVAFEDVFADLFAGASDAAGGIDTGNLAGAANLLFTSGGDIIDSLQDGGAGADFISNRLADDGLVDEQIGLLGDDLARFLAEDVNPAITSGGVVASTLGGSRGEVQRGIETGRAAEAFARGAADIRMADQAQRDNLATSLMTSEAGRNATALDGLGEVFGLAEAGAMADLSPFAALANVLGPQLALTESSSFGAGESVDFSEALADAFGFNIDQTTGRAGSMSRSSSRSSGRSARFGFGSGG